MSESRIRLALEWLELHPEVKDAVEGKLRDLEETYNRASENVSKLGLKGKVAGEVTKRLAERFDREKAALVATDKSIGWVLDAYEEQERASKAAEKRLRGYGERLTRIGVRLGWFSYRLVMIGRVLLRYFLEPVKKVISLLRNWERTLETTVFSLAFLSSQGLITSEVASDLFEAMMKLPEAGLKVQAAFGLLEGVLAKIGIALAPVITSGLIEVAQALLEVWNNVEPLLIPALETFVNNILPSLISLIKDVGPAIIIGFVNGLTAAIPLIIGFLNALKPILPLLAQIVGFIVPFLPLLIGLGTALYIVSTLFQFFGGVILILAAILGKLGVVSAAVSPAVSTLGAAIGTAGAAATPAIPIILALGGAVALAGAGFLMAGAGVMLAVNSIMQLIPQLTQLAALVPVLASLAAGLIGVGAAGLLLIPASIGILALSGAIVTLSGAIALLTSALVALTAAAKAFNEVGEAIKSAIGGISSAIGGLASALGSLCFRHVIPIASRFSETLSEASNQTKQLTSNVDRLGRGLRGIPEVGAGTLTSGGNQHVSVYAPISIGSVSGIEDLSRVADVVSRGIAEALRRRG